MSLGLSDSIHAAYDFIYLDNVMLTTQLIGKFIILSNIIFIPVSGLMTWDDVSYIHLCWVNWQKSLLL